MKETQDLDFNSFLVYDAPTVAGKNALSDMSLFKLADACRKYGERKSKARDAKLHEFMKRQAEDCLVMAKHDDSINARNEADIWLKALLLV